MKKFCRECGSKLELVENGKYDEETGEKIKVLVCPNDTCEENCAFYGHTYKKYSWWWPDSWECLKCGYRPRDIF